MQLWKLHFGWVATFGRLGIILVIVNWKTVQDLINQCNRYFGWPHTSLTIFHNYGLRMVELGLGGVWFICVVGEPLVQLWSFLREYAIISWYIRLFFFFFETLVLDYSILTLRIPEKLSFQNFTNLFLLTTYSIRLNSVG